MKRSLFVLSVLLGASCAFAADGLETRPPLRRSPAKSDSAHGYDVQSYTLWIGLPFTNDSLYGHVRMGAFSRQGGLASVALNAAGLTIDSVSYNGRDTTFASGADILTIGLPGLANGEHFTIDAFYRLGNRGSSPLGYYWYPQGFNAGTLHAVAYSMSEPQDARCWMPCFDEQWDKADSGCSIAVTAPDSFAVASNGTFQDTTRSGDRLTWRWREDSPIATYLMCFTASRYDVLSDSAPTESGPAVPLRYFVWPEDSALASSVFSTMPGMVRLYDSLFHAYPFDKYGMAAVYPFAFGGMEHQTMTTIHRYWILWNNYRAQRGIAHELAHMWYGDLVTCGTWADIWLNEGFASYCEALYDERLNVQKPGVYLMQYFSAALSGNANLYQVYDPPAALLFDPSLVYYKGAWVLQGLRWAMGDSLFFPAMHAYADSFAYGNAVTTDFQRIAEHFYGSSLQWYFDEWLHRAGHPKYTTVTYYKTQPDSNAAFVSLTQTSTTGEIYKMPLQLACSTRAGVRNSVHWDSTDILDEIAITDTLPVLQVSLDRDNWILKEWGDSLPHLSSLFTIIKKGNSVIVAEWDPFDIGIIDGYNLYRSQNNNGPFTRVNTNTITGTAYWDSSVNSGETYYYAVTAIYYFDTNYETHFSNVLSQMAGGVSGGPGAAAHGVLSLGQNRPNPFTVSTAMRYELATASPVRLSVFNATGQLVRTLVDQAQTPGAHSCVWNGRDQAGRPASSGVYYYRLRAEGKTLVKAMRLIK